MDRLNRVHRLSLSIILVRLLCYIILADAWKEPLYNITLVPSNKIITGGIMNKDEICVRLDNLSSYAYDRSRSLFIV